MNPLPFPNSNPESQPGHIDYSKLPPPPPPPPAEQSPPPPAPNAEQYSQSPAVPPPDDSSCTPHGAQTCPAVDAPAVHAIAPGGPNNADNADNADFDIAEVCETPFPIHCLPEVMRQMVADVSRVGLLPIPLPAVCALGTISAALGAGLELQTEGGKSVRGNLAIWGVAKSGSGKGVAFDLITSQLRDSQDKLLRDWSSNTQPGLAAELEVIEKEIKVLTRRIGAKKADMARDQIIEEMKRLKGAKQAVEAQLIEPCLATANATKEAIAELLSHGKNEALASMSSEARDCVDVLCGRHNKKTDEGIYLAGYSGDSVPIHRKGSPPIHLRKPCLSMLWLFQPDKLWEILKMDAMTSSGMLARILLVLVRAEPQHMPEHHPAINAAVKSNWDALVAGLVATFHQAEKPFNICTSPEVSTLFRKYYNETVDQRRSGGALADVSEYAARWCENAWRLALVLHAAEHGQNASNQGVSQATANNAITLMKWFADQQLQILSTGREEKRRARMFELKEVLLDEPGSTCTLRNLERLHGFGVAEVKSLAKEYPDKLVVEVAPHSGPGRPSPIARLPV